MKIFVIVVSLIIITQGCSGQHSQNSNSILMVLDSLSSENSFFELNTVYQKNLGLLSRKDKLRYGALLENLFGQYDSSNLKTKELLSKYADSLSSLEKSKSLMLRLSNSIKLFDYKSAFEASYELINNYDQNSSKAELWDLKNNHKIWESLRNEPPQKIVSNGDIMIERKADRLGVKNVSISNKILQIPFVFDSGANISVVIESVAKELNLETKNINVQVSTITGNRVDAQISVAKSLWLDKIHLKNVVFLVFPDDALFFPQMNYQIKGVLGFPVLSALKEIHFLKNNNLFIPKESDNDKKSNMAIEYLTPYINLKVNDEPIYFSFDTGANKTFLYEKFYLKFKDQLINKELVPISFAGAGGQTERDGYKADISLCHEDKCIEMKDLSLFPSQTTISADEKSYGNLGQDYISKFEKMIINFEKMFIHFE